MTATGSKKKFRTPPSWSIERRLEYFTDRTLGPDACWNWKGVMAGGNGLLYASLTYRNKLQRASRLTWLVTHGPIPKGMHVCHHRDNTRCVNPRHLFLGTDLDNHRDRDAKGRGLKGRNRPEIARLSEAQVLAIRSDTRKRDLVAAEYGVSGAHISNIRLGKRRPYVTSKERVEAGKPAVQR